MSALAAWLTDNPVLTKELRVRMRGARAYWILTGYLTFLSFILFVQYTSWWSQTSAQGSGVSLGSKIGQEFFQWIAWTQAFLVAFITPAVTCGAFTIEREQRTMEMLELTRLPRGSIVWGKLLAAVGFVALLLVSSLPLASICFFLGGVSPEEMARAYALLLAGAFVTGAVGLAWSTVARTTSAAITFTYGTLLLPLAGLLGLGIVTAVGTLGSASYGLSLVGLLAAGAYGLYTPEMASLGSGMSAIVQAWDGHRCFGLTLPVWLPPALTYSLLGVTLAAVASARLETFPERKAGLLRGLVALSLAEQLFFYFGARFAVYWASAGPPLPAPVPVLHSLTFPAFLIVMIAPIFSTGELRTVEARRLWPHLLWGWTPQGLKRARLASGLPYLLLLVALTLALYVLSHVVSGQAAMLQRGEILSGAASQVAPAGAAPPSAPRAVRIPPAALWQAAAALTASVAGIWAVGFLCSVLLRSRWTALAVLYLVVVATLVAPAVAQAGYSYDPSNRAPSIWVNLFYLSPLMAIAELSDGTDQFWNGLNLMFGRTPIWQVGVAAHLLIVLVSLLFAAPFVSRIAARPVLPYEDLPARV